MQNFKDFIIIVSVNKAVIGIVVVLLLAGGAFLFLRKGSSQGTTPSTVGRKDSSTTTTEEKFSTPKKAAHFESNTPEHASVLAAVPINVIIDFNFDLAKGSNIEIMMNGKDYGVGETIIDEGGLAMRRKMDSNAPDGIYTVSYIACWADGSCHDGQFQFKVDRKTSSEFTDMTGQDEVPINLKNTQFNPTRVKVSRGTKVTWVNQDNVDHTVNTDPHPAHTFFPEQNSRTLANGDTYSVTFDEAGIYPYHCTPHAGIMKGQILVE